MESRTFIKEAATVMKQIEQQKIYSITRGVDANSASNIQRQLDILFGSLQNPTLPSASRLMESALDAGYTVDRRVQQRIRQFA